MSTTTTSRTTTYEVRVAGHLDDHWATWLDDLTLVRHDDGTTVLTGPLYDQSQLHGLLARVRDLGAPLLSLRSLDSPASAAETRADAAAVLRHPLCTERLTLRPATEADADVTWTYRRLGSVGEWLTEVPTDLETYRSTFAEPERLAATVIVTLGHDPAVTVIGDFMLRVEDAWAQAEATDDAKGSVGELGWVLDPVHTGHGYATEAVRALLVYCFTSLGLRRVVANCFLAKRHLLAPHGTRRHAPRGPRHRRVAPPVRAMAGHRHLRRPGRRVVRLSPSLRPGRQQPANGSRNSNNARFSGPHVAN
jgi:RimJ/RimL family protein N-acetyltransferase